MKFVNRTFESENAPEATKITYAIVSFFRDAFFEFISLFMLLYVQMASPITGIAQYTVMYTVITFSLVGSKILAGFAWVLASHWLAYGHFPFGRYRTLLFYGAILTTISFLLLFFVSPLFEGWAYVVAFILFYTLLICIYSINDIAYWSFSNTLSRDEEKRGRISSMVSFSVALGTYAVAGISPAVSTGDAKSNFTLLGSVLIAAYFLSQMVLAFVIRERKENPEDILKQKKDNVLEPFRILFSNRQVLYVCIAFFILFLSQDILIGNSSNYFYYEYGYGSFGDHGYGNSMFSGGVVSFIFSLCFGAGIAIAQALYSPISVWLKKKYTLLLAFALIVFGYLFLFAYAFRNGHEIALFPTTFLLAFGHGLCYMTMSMNVFDVAEDHEYKTGLDKNPAIQSLKSFMVLFANAVQTGVLYLFFAISHLSSVNQRLGKMESAGAAIDAVNDMVHQTAGISSSLNIFLSGLTLLPLVLTTIAILLTVFFVDVNDEAKYMAIVRAIEERKKQQHL